MLLTLGLFLAVAAPVRLVQAADQPNGRVAIVGATATTAFDEAGAAIALAPGDTVTASARSEDGAWFLITTAAEVSGWVAADELIIFGAAYLPVFPLPVAVANSTAALSVAENVRPTPPPIADTGAVTATTTLSNALALLQRLAAPSTTEPLAQTESPSAQMNNGAVASTTPSATDDVLAPIAIEITAKGLNVRSGPGMAYPVITEVKAGDQFPVIARNSSSDWLQIMLPAGDGWVAVGYIRSATPLTDLPVAATSDQASAPNTASNVNTPSSVVSSQSSVVSGQSSVVPSAPGLSGKLVFSDGQGGVIYLYDLASGALRTLTSGIDPALSPDGNKVLFTRSGGDNGIYVINTDGSGEHKIFGERELLTSPKWSPDGQWIVFSRLDGTYKCVDTGRALCPSVQQLLGSIPSGLTAEQLAAVQARRASTLARLDTVERPNWALARINPQGGDYRDIAALNSALAPDWNAAGIVYQSTAGLQRTADQPEDVNQAVFNANNIQDPAWQPNGGRIVYQQKRGSRWEIFSVNPDGTGNVVLTQPKTTLVEQLPSNVAPAWSPNGLHIVFLSNREADGEAGAWRIWVMDADGGNQHPLPIDVALDYGFTQQQMVSWGQ